MAQTASVRVFRLAVRLANAIVPSAICRDCAQASEYKTHRAGDKQCANDCGGREDRANDGNG